MLVPRRTCVLGRATPAIAGLWRCGLLPRSLACCGFEPAAVWESNFTRPTPSTRRRPVTASARWRGPHRPAAAGERGPDAVELFGAALPPGPGEVLVVANFGILHMPASAGDPNKFEARTKHALRRLDKISRAAGLSVTVLLVAPPTLRGLRSPGLHPAQLEAFAPAMKRLATEGLGVSVRVLDLAPLSAARADASFDGLHYVREVPAAAVDAALGMLCEL